VTAALPALPPGWSQDEHGRFDLDPIKYNAMSVRTGFDFHGMSTTRFSAEFGDMYVPDVVLARRLAALGWTVTAPEVTP
jgi:hypothetical protein